MIAIKYQLVMGGMGGASEGISSIAMQQAGLGVVLTVLLIATPPIAAIFFQGTLASFSAYSQFGQAQARDKAGIRWGQEVGILQCQMQLRLAQKGI